MAKIQTNFISVLTIWNNYLNKKEGQEILKQHSILEIMIGYCLSGAPKPVFGDTMERMGYIVFIMLIKNLISKNEIQMLRIIGFINSEFDEYINNLSFKQNKEVNTLNMLCTENIDYQNNRVNSLRYPPKTHYF